MNNLEKKLAKFFKRKYCLLTGNGTTGMYLIFSNFKKKISVLYPSITCIQAVNAAIFAGHKVSFSDVDKNRFVMNYKNFLNSVTEDVSIVVPTHTFGNTCQIEEIIEYCKKKKIFVFEDATQSMGAKINNKITGSFGNASVLSFGYSKILDCGYGGCILCDDKITYKNIKKNYLKLNELPKNYLDILKVYKKKFYDLEKKISNKKKKIEEIIKLQNRYKKILIFKIDKKKQNLIKKKFATLKIVIKKRNTKHLLYKKIMKNIKPIKTSKDFVSWRFTGIVNKNRNSLLKKLRDNKINASAWYPSLHYLNNYQKKNFSNSINIDKKIINLWTDENTNFETILNTAKIINQEI